MKHLMIAAAISFGLNYLFPGKMFGIIFFCAYPIVGLAYRAYKDSCAKKLGSYCACRNNDVACRYEKEKSE